MENANVELSNKKKIKNSVITSVISLVLFVSIILFVYKYKTNFSIQVTIAIVIVGLIIFLAGFITVIQAGRKIGYFFCSNCNEKFVPSIMTYMCAAHVFKSSYMKCPKCKKKNWCRKKME